MLSFSEKYSLERPLLLSSLWLSSSRGPAATVCSSVLDLVLHCGKTGWDREKTNEQSPLNCRCCEAASARRDSLEEQESPLQRAEALSRAAMQDASL